MFDAARPQQSLNTPGVGVLQTVAVTLICQFPSRVRCSKRQHAGATGLSDRLHVRRRHPALAGVRSWNV